MASAARQKRDGVFLLSLCFVTLLLISGAAAAAERDASYGAVKATIWTPDEPLAAPAPVILFSHGFHGCATQSRFLMRALADDGYIVLAPNHKDAVCHDGAAHIGDRSEEAFRHPEKWTDTTYADRAADMRNLIAGAKADFALAGLIDWTRLGLAGHSLGGYTVLGLGGAWPSWLLPGVKAILALSPYAEPYIVHETLKNLSAPVMYQGGTRDRFITPDLRKTHGVYDQSPSPKFFVEFDGARHASFSDRFDENHAVIIAYSLAFLDTYVKGLPFPPQLHDFSKGVANFAFQAPAAAANFSADKPEPGLCTKKNLTPTAR